MSRLIDADALIKSTDKEIVHMWEIALAPTVDAIEVVRCKNCAYWGTKVVYANGERADCLNFNFVTPCDFFCKWGERREDGEVD